MSCASTLFGQEFTSEEIEQTRRSNGLLTMEIEVGTLCNFACRYCYVGDGIAVKPLEAECELTLEEIQDVIAQAQALGARKIILLGGEPMLYEFTLGLCDWIRARGMGVELFTNGTNMTAGASKRLFDAGVHVVLKWHSSNADTQSWLSGVPDAHHVIHQAYQHLRTAGYPGPHAKFALSTVICRQNIEELPALWCWMREIGIEPYFEMITPQGRAIENGATLSPSVEDLHRLFELIQKLDAEKFGRVWEAQPPLVGNTCLRHSFSCLINAKGDVMPCVGVQIPVGNIRKQPLAKILEDSEVIEDLRNHKMTIQGACGQCDKAASCYGCRGAAYQMTGNYLGSDPLCWRNQDGAECSCLPMSAASLLPHQPPTRMVDTLETVSERAATVRAHIAPDNPHCKEGRLLESAHLELMAQAAATLQGFRTRVRPDGKAQKGMLIGARDLTIIQPIAVGDQLEVHVHKETRLGTFGILKAEIRRDNEVVSTAELKTWHEE
jgi:radical SAM protein with 4Fe4S-binding SPASM domain